jgi:peroxiredoxin
VTGLRDGATAPDFTLRDQHGQSVSLSAYRGRSPVLLVFYPAAFSRVCSGELTALRDGWPLRDGADAELLAVSCDPVFSLRAASDAERIAFPLLSDFWPHGAVSAAYGVFDRDLGTSRRSSFVLDREGRVRWQVHHATPDARRLEEYRRALSQLAR